VISIYIYMIKVEIYNIPKMSPLRKPTPVKSVSF